ncbi:MAG: penicillin-binding protein 1C [Reinekea sp.]
MGRSYPLTMTLAQYLKTMFNPRRLSCRRGLFWGLLSALLLIATAFWFSLPEPLFSTPYSTILVDRHGQLLGAKISADEQWRFPEGNAVPEKFKIAIIAYEDKRFLHHLGIDPLAMVRALTSNIRQNRIVSGASTLTMQVIRLSRDHPDRTYANKIIEALLALRLELSYSKDDILTLYANHAPFGGNVVGIEAAAWRYFGRPANELSWAEAATLAVLPNQPSLVHLNRNRERLKAKRNALLADLYEAGEFTEIDYRLALLEPLPESPKPLPQLAPHLFETLIREQPHQYRIKTTLDAGLQSSLQSVMTAHADRLLNQGIHNAALLVIDRSNMDVVAYFGNSFWKTTGDQGYAIDLIQAERSTGSILKPFLFTQMIQHGLILPHTLIQDRPTLFKGYRPENFDRQYRGAVPASEALTRSLNIPSVRMLSQYGVEAFYSDLKTLGMTTLFRTPDGYGLPLILGGAEGTLWDISQMYANLAQATQSAQRRPVQRLIHVLPMANEKSAESSLPFGPGAAWITLNTLLDVTRPGLDSHWRSFSSSQKISWKTGTSHGLRDGWAVGNNGHYTVGVWTGNATGVGNARLTGLHAAAPLMFDTFNRLGRSPWLDKPLRFLKTVRACDDDGYLSNGYCQASNIEVPDDSFFEQASPYHQRVHLDADKLLRVHNQCEQVSRMRTVSWFVLPPALEYFYQQSHDDYRALPPYRSDCAHNAPMAANPIGMIYPNEGTEVYIPTDLDGQKGAVVFEAVHRNPQATLYWHLDETFLTQTREFHQVELTLAPGWHRLTLVDDTGASLQRRFLVLGE